ncbi:MAG: cell division protein FtsK [Comamonadaceae bacterium]|nr:MAG: cell division protein FtsK [Comamonadaceae bacterium]
MVDDADTPPIVPSTPTDNVVRGTFGTKAQGRPRKTKAEHTDAAPSSTSSANASNSGIGESDRPKPGRSEKKKPECVVDWGKFNLLVERFALIYGTDTVWDGGHRIIMKIGNMAHAHGSDLVRMWKTSEKRRTVTLQDVVFDPTEQCGDHCVNLFGGMAMEPQVGSVEPIIDLVRFLVSRTSEDEMEVDAVMHWLLCWIAYPLQNLGTKLRTAVIMHGDEGAGKNFLFDLVVDIYGQYGVLVGQDELEDKFNDWRSGKMMVIGDEVSSRAELVHNKNRLKSLITSTSVQINPKNLPRRTESNHINIVFLSNELQPLALDNSDRRYLVVYTPRAREFEYYRRLKKWRDDGGAQRFYRYLLDYDCEGFDPFAPAPFTRAKADLIDINRKTPERFWMEWHQGLLDLPYRSCSVDQAYQAYLKYAQRIGDRFPLQNNVFTRMLTRFAEGQDHPVRVKTMQITQVEGGRKAYRMLLICEPPPGIKEGEWATETVQEFNDALRKYLGGGWAPRSPTEAEQADRGNE